MRSFIVVNGVLLPFVSDVNSGLDSEVVMKTDGSNLQQSFGFYTSQLSPAVSDKGSYRNEPGERDSSLRLDAPFNVLIIIFRHHGAVTS